LPFVPLNKVHIARGGREISLTNRLALSILQMIAKAGW
jgi:hypothetical protein